MNQNNKWLCTVIALEKAIAEKHGDGRDKLRKLTNSARQALPLTLIGSDLAFEQESPRSNTLSSGVRAN